MSTFLRYVKLQLQSLMCLGVGPIFLFIYFAGEPQPPTWLLWTGLPLTILSVLLALLATKIGARTMFSPRTDDDMDDPNVDDRHTFAGRLRDYRKER